MDQLNRLDVICINNKMTYDNLVLISVKTKIIIKT